MAAKTQTPTITKKQAKNTLSGKKRKTEVIKNVLTKPYQNYWPLLSSEDNNHIIDILDKFLPKIKPPKTVILYKEIKTIPKNERKNFRKTFEQKGDQEVDELNRKNLIFGVNDVTKLIENQEAGCVLVASDVTPRLFAQHVLDQAVLFSVPILVVNELKSICRKKCGLSGSVIAVKKSVEPDSVLGMIQQTVSNIYENYPVPENHINYNRRLDITTITIPDSENNESVISVSEEEEEEVIKNYHLKKVSNGRAFVPEKSTDSKTVEFIQLDSIIMEDSDTLEKSSEIVEFIELDSGRVRTTRTSNKTVKNQKRTVRNDKAVQYQSLKVKRLKGDKNRNKRKMQKFKKKKN